MRFTKMQACGNDYIYVNCFEEKVEDPAGLAVRLSDRHYGIGSDGLILIEPSEKADAFMHMFNLDGSEGRMCGNGIRCVAKYIYDNRLIPEDRRHAVIDTRAGLRTVKLEVKDGLVSAVTVDMGTAVCTGHGRLGLDAGITAGGSEAVLEYTAMDMGNPHAVIFFDEKAKRLLTPDHYQGEDGCVRDRFEEMNIRNVGMKLQSSPAFPDGVNVEFIEVTGRNEIRMRVWERGSEETLACGTGAAASAAAGCMAGKLDSPVLVHLEGGDITIDFDSQTGKCFMTGPAVTVFIGEVDVTM